MLPNSRTNYRLLQNKSQRRENILEMTQWASSISLYLSSVSLYPTLLASELYRRKSGHREPRKTFQVSEDNTSWATRCQHVAVNHPQNRVHAAKNNYWWRQSPSIIQCTGCCLKIATGRSNGPNVQTARVTMAHRWNLKSWQGSNFYSKQAVDWDFKYCTNVSFITSLEIK